MTLKKTISKRMFRKEKLIRCILNDCQGVCCTYGVWIDLKEKQRIFENLAVVQSCMDQNSVDFDEWFKEDIENDPYTESGVVVHSRVVERDLPFSRETCVFLRPDHKCALQVASQLLGKHPWFLKPFYCILHPMDINQDGEITLDETNIISEEPKSCLRVSCANLAPIEIFEEELRYLLGDSTYLDYLNQAEKFWGSKSNQEIK
jgi:hypothetical protein